MPHRHWDSGSPWKRGRKNVRARGGGGVLWKAEHWTRHDCRTHELKRQLWLPKADQAIKKFQYGGGQLALPPLDEELLIAEGCDRWEPFFRDGWQLAGCPCLSPHSQAHIVWVALIGLSQTDTERNLRWKEDTLEKGAGGVGRKEQSRYNEDVLYTSMKISKNKSLKKWN